MKRFLILSLLLVFLFAALAYGIYDGLTKRVVGANDFYSRWAGARALFLARQNPYSDSVTQQIQTGMYGRLARPDEDQVAFAYPLYTAFIVAPLVAMPYSQAQALWMAVLIMAAVGGSIVLARVHHVRLTPLMFGGLLFGALVFYPAVRGIFLGQLALVSFFCLALAVWAVQSGWDAFAGVLVAFATVKPQTAIFFLPAILLWAAWQRRWRIVGGAVVTLCALCLLALVFVPTWPLDFVQAIRQYSVYEPVGPPVQTAIELLRRDPVGSFITLTLEICLVGWLATSVFRSLNANWEGFQPTLCLVAIVTTWTAGRVGTPDQLLLIFPLTYWLGEWLARSRYAQAAILAVGFVLLPWLVFLSTLRGNAEDVVVTLVLPILALVIFIWQQFSGRLFPVRSVA